MALAVGACASTSRTVVEHPGGGTAAIGARPITLEEFRANRPPADFLTARRLVPANAHAPEIRTALVYATADNLTGRPLYPPDMPCLLDADTARRLGEAQDVLRPQGFGLLVWDAYRPTAVQRKLFAAPGAGAFVANPAYGFSRHSSGRAVDVTLYDLRSGETLAMPSGFDDFSDRASSDYRGGSRKVARNLRRLRRAMKAAGFVGIEMEWWHYENADYQYYDIPPIDPRDYGIVIPN